MHTEVEFHSKEVNSTNNTFYFPKYKLILKKHTKLKVNNHMGPVQVAIVGVIGNVSLKLIEQFLMTEGCSRLKKFLFPKNTYQRRLIQIINETINEFELKKQDENIPGKFPFYHSQTLFEELNKHILFDNSHTDLNSVIELFKINPNIIIPKYRDLEIFYELFTTKIKSDNKLKKMFVEENYKNKIFQLGEEISRIEHKIDTMDSTIQELCSEILFQPSHGWFKEQCKTSIDDLGNRYTSDINVELKVSDIFEGLGRTEEFKSKLTEQFDQLLIKGKKLLKNEPEIKDHLIEIENSLDELQALFYRTDLLGTSSIPVNDFVELLNKSYSHSQNIYDYYFSEENKIQKEKNNYQYFHKYGYKIIDIRKFQHKLLIFQDLIDSTSFKLANNPYLLLFGEAGIGKSHLIGSVISKRINLGYESVFLLGQYFVTDEDPWTQIFKILQINSKKEDFLRKLNQRAETSGKRIIIFIDAINEGRGNYFWSCFVKSFINEIKKYKWLGLVLTIRTSYKDLIFIEDESSELGMIEHRHYGFKNVEYEASKFFFESYEVELPNVPLLNPEFQNPLFLKLFCEGVKKAGLTRIPDGIQGLTSIINFFVENVNTVLSKPQRVGYSRGLNLVKKSIHALIKYKIDNQLRYIPYEKAHIIVNESISDFIDKRGFIDELITEGVLSKSLFWKDKKEYEEAIFFAYERFEDHLTVQYLLEQHQELKKEFRENGKLYNYIENESAIYRFKGLIEAFSIQVPEIKGYEFYSLIPDVKNKYPVIESFVESLLWRKAETINEESKKYINEHVFSYPGTQNFFWEIIISVTGVPDHFYNAYFIHDYLINHSLADRDAEWTQLLKYKFDNSSSVKRLIDWAWSETDKSYISNESILLSSITLAWFHTSTNRKLRDYSTKALICLLQNRLDILLELMEMFENVNDPYIEERLFAVAYGCVLRTNQKGKIQELSEYIFKRVFSDSTNVTPHILLRDYARGTIEYAHYLRIELSFELSKVRPPYLSSWPKNIPKWKKLEEKYDNRNYRHIWNSVMGFGDFSRYIIGTNHGFSGWLGYKIGDTPIDRKQVYRNFKNKLNLEQLKLLSSLDPIITRESSKDIDLKFSNMISAIAVGRKTDEEINETRKIFKESLSTKLLLEYEKEIEPFLDKNHKIINTKENFDLRIAQRLIMSRVIDLGWDPDLHLLFDETIAMDRGQYTTFHERIGKKYQWIAYHEYMALLSDNFVKKKKWNTQQKTLYQGPWEPFVRDIDPTLLISKTGSYDDEKQKEFWWENNNKVFNWECTNENWVKDRDTMPKIEDIIQVMDDKGEEWLVLEGYPSWVEPKKIGEEKWSQPRKELWCHVRSYLVKKDEFKSLKKWIVKQDFMGRWMPESGDISEMFSREYYWSPAQNCFMTEYYGGTRWKEVYNKESGEYIAKVNVTAQGFLWGRELDKSKEEAIGFLKPSIVIYEGMDLKYGKREGEFVDHSQKLQCFAANVYHNSKSYLLVRKKSFLKFLNDNKLEVVWTVLGEKQIIGGSSFGAHYLGRVEISGAYYYENKKLEGSITTKIN